MSVCKVRAWATPDPNFGASGVSVAQGVCETHGWQFPSGCITAECPVGRIERAVEEGVAKIVKAIEEQTNATTG